MKELKPKAKILLGLLTVTALFSACGRAPSSDSSLSTSFDTGILGGTPVTSDDPISKSTVALESDDRGVFCTGVLIAKNLIVTAAHCTSVTPRPTMMRAVFGLDLNGKLEKRQILGGQVPEQWPQLKNEQDKNWGDIAVLRFDGEAPEGFEPVTLLAPTRKLRKGLNVLISGYGLTGMHPMVDPQKLMQATVKLSDPHFSESEFKFDLTDGKATCHGDSGGPTFLKSRGKLYLLAVTSRSATIEGSATCQDGSISTAIPSYYDFILKASETLNSKDFVANQPIPRPSMGM